MNRRQVIQAVAAILGGTLAKACSAPAEEPEHSELKKDLLRSARQIEDLTGFAPTYGVIGAALADHIKNEFDLDLRDPVQFEEFYDQTNIRLYVYE